MQIYGERSSWPATFVADGKMCFHLSKFLCYSMYFRICLPLSIAIELVPLMTIKVKFVFYGPPISQTKNNNSELN